MNHLKFLVPVCVCILLSQLLALLIIPTPALAASSVLVSELQTASIAHASDEFVELYNPTSASVDLAGWKLQYHSASNTDCTQNWTNKITLGSASIAAHGFFLLSSTGYLAAADAYFSPGLASTGAVRLVSSNSSPQTAAAWGSGASCGNGSSAAAPPAGASLERRPGADAEAGGNAYNTGNDAIDFLLRSKPNPQSTAAPTEDPVANYVPGPITSGQGTPSGAASDGSNASVSSSIIELNELLPDPAAPLADAHDEFIEFFNPNDVPVDLAGYAVKTGANLSTKHTLPEAIVPPGGYLALISGTTRIQFSNSGTSVALFDPAGHQLGVTITYPKAPTGDAWALNDGIWSWTTTPTPNAANLITAPLTSTSSSSKASSSKAKYSTSKTKSTQSTAAKALKTAKATVAAAATPALTAASTPSGRWLLFALAGLTIAYVIYEFRYDVRNLYFKFRGHPDLGAPAGSKPQGRRRARTSE